MRLISERTKPLRQAQIDVNHDGGGFLHLWGQDRTLFCGLWFDGRPSRVEKEADLNLNLMRMIRLSERGDAADEAQSSLLTRPSRLQSVRF